MHESNSGSNAGAITATATKEGNEYVVNGSKFLIRVAEKIYSAALKSLQLIDSTDDADLLSLLNFQACKNTRFE